MDQTEFQQVILQKLEKDCPNSNITYLGDYDGQLAFSIKLRTKLGVRFVVTGYPVYALVEPGDFERYRLVSDLDFKITDHFSHQSRTVAPTMESVCMTLPLSFEASAFGLA